MSRPKATRILIIKPSSLGDIVHALPVLVALREAHPQAHIAWLVGTSFAALLDRHPFIDEVIPFDRTRFGKMWRSPTIFVDFWRFIADLRRRRFDLVIDLQGLIRSGLMAWLSGAKQTIGFADAREGAWLFYKSRVRCPAGSIHAVEKNLCVARELGLDTTVPRFPLALRDNEQSAARELLARVAGRTIGSFAALIPGARWESKLWPPQKFAELCDRLAQTGQTCVLIGAPSDRALADAIVAGAKHKPIDLVGKTSLRQMVALLDLAERVVCCDSGPMHIAAALDKPIVALFGPTDPKRTGPYTRQARVVTNPVPCACMRRVCPLGHHNCLEKLTVECVIAP